MIAAPVIRRAPSGGVAEWISPREASPRSNGHGWPLPVGWLAGFGAWAGVQLGAGDRRHPPTDPRASDRTETRQRRSRNPIRTEPDPRVRAHRPWFRAARTIRTFLAHSLSPVVVAVRSTKNKALDDHSGRLDQRLALTSNHDVEDKSPVSYVKELLNSSGSRRHRPFRGLWDEVSCRYRGGPSCAYAGVVASSCPISISATKA